MALSYAAYGVFILLTVSLLISSVSCEATELSVYKADSKSDMEKLDEWFSMINSTKNSMKDDKTAKHLLCLESCPRRNNQNDAVCDSFRYAKGKPKDWKEFCQKSRLWMAECYALHMYTDKAYTEFNEAAMKGDFQTYKVFNYLLNCAVQRLSLDKNFQVEDNVKLYRNLKSEHTRPKADRIFWKAFTSTSLDKSVALKFGKATEIEFEPKATKFGAKIMEFSKFPLQKEVLIPPFEGFDVLECKGKDPKIIRVRSSNIQSYDLSSICRK